MNKPQLNLQDLFLNQVRKENISVTIYLVNSVQLRGVVRGFDAFTILLDSVGRPTQLVYKHAVTSIVPSRPVSTFYAEAHREGHPQERPGAAPRPAGAPAPAAPAQGAPPGAPTTPEPQPEPQAEPQPAPEPEA